MVMSTVMLSTEVCSNPKHWKFVFDPLGRTPTQATKVSVHLHSSSFP